MKSYVWVFFTLILAGGLAVSSHRAKGAQSLPAYRYSAAAIRGQVIANDTGRPVEGVSILALWTGDLAVPPVFMDTLYVKEVATLADGTFVIDGWTSSSLRSAVSKESPKIIYFAPGYDIGWLDIGKMSMAEVRQIRMRRFEGPLVTWAQKLGELAAQLGMFAAPLPGNPTFQMVRAIAAEWQRLPASAWQDTKAGSLITVFEGTIQEWRAAYDQWRLQSGAMPKGIPTTPVSPPQTYSAKEIHTTVVDEETGRPLEGVVIVARWVLRRMYGDGPSLHVAEATTDTQGRFVISGWGPKPRPPLMHLQDKSPEILLFKHGYTPLTLRNESRKKVETFLPTYRTMPTKQLRNLTAWYQGSPDRNLSIE